MAGQTTDSGLITQAIGRYLSYRLLVIPAVALLMVMADVRHAPQQQGLRVRGE